MIPKQNNHLWSKAKYSILEAGDEILAGDQYYNPAKDKWLPVEKDTIGDSWNSDHYKPIRRRAGGKVESEAKKAFDKLEVVLGADYYYPLPEDAAIAIRGVQSIIYKNFIK